MTVSSFLSADRQVINRYLKMEIWAHRGRTSPLKLGNSVTDFMACYRLEKKGLTGIETDVCLTADGKPIIYHPGSTVPELTNMAWRDIADSIFDVLPLSTFLSHLRSYSKMPCCLDIKQNSRELVEKVVDTVAERRIQDRIYITVFQKRMDFRPFNIETGAELLLLAKKLDPSIRTHLIAPFPFNLPALVEKYHPDIISFGWLDDHLLTKAFFNLAVEPFVDLKKQTSKIKELGTKVLGGIINTTEEMKLFANFGVDGIMTDNVLLGLEAP